MVEEMRLIGERLRGLREACDTSAEDIAQDLGVSVETYLGWEENGEDVPISAIYHIASALASSLPKSSPARPQSSTHTRLSAAEKAAK